MLPSPGPDSFAFAMQLFFFLFRELWRAKKKNPDTSWFVTNQMLGIYIRIIFACVRNKWICYEFILRVQLCLFGKPWLFYGHS